jgi:hypothetical protein
MTCPVIFAPFEATITRPAMSSPVTVTIAMPVSPSPGITKSAGALPGFPRRTRA